MADKVSSRVRSRIMSSVGTRNTKPEIAVRSLLHAMGYRFRLHRSDLPGTPDIVLTKYNLVIFVHGCFWHRHVGCPRATTPTTNIEFWSKKFKRNKARDRENQKALVNLGWTVLVIWECELRNEQRLSARLKHCFAQL